MIALYAQAGKLEIPAAVQASINPAMTVHPEAITAAILAEQVGQQQARGFWMQARRRFYQTRTQPLDALQTQLGYGPQYSSFDTWSQHGGHLIGAATRTEVETCHGSRRNSPFHEAGAGWDEVLVLPFYLAPGLLAGFLFAGRQLDPAAGDYCYRALGHIPAGSVTPVTCLSNHGPDPAIVCLDPLVAVQLQLRQQADGQPLPLVGALPGSGTLWPARLPATPLVWSPQSPDHALRIARQHDARVSGYLPSGPLQRFIRNSHVPTLLSCLQQSGQPWADRLRYRLQQCAPAQVPALLDMMQFSPAEATQFAAASPEPLRLRLQAAGQASPQYLLFCGRQVHERDTGWYHGTGHGEIQICDAVIRIRRILYAATGHLSYQGTIQYQGKQLTFDAPGADAEKNLFGWLRSWLLSQGHGRLRYSGKWAKDAVDLATAFHTPETCCSTGRVGWQAQPPRFNLPGCTIELGGRVQAESCLPLGLTDLPATELPAPAAMPIPPEALAALGSPTAESRLFWQVWLAVVHNVVAPAVGQSPRRIFLAGTDRAAAGVIARKLGCLELPGARWPAALAHDWPYLRQPPRRQYANMVVTPSNYLMPVFGLQPRVLSLTGDWLGIVQSLQLSQLGPALTAGPQLLVDYLQDLCRRQFQLRQSRRQSLSRQLAADALAWWEALGGPAHGPTQAWRYFRHGDRVRQAQRLRDLLQRLVLRRQLPVYPQDFATRCAPSGVELGPDAVWIPRQAVAQAIERATGLRLDLLLITRILQTAGVLHQEQARGRHVGWLVRADWWSALPVPTKESPECDAATPS